MDEVLAHFKKADPVLYPVVAAALESDKPIALRPPAKPESYFREIAEAIVSQQLSVKAADTIWNRFEALVDEVTPENVLKVDTDDVRAVGLSGAKASYIQSIARSFIGNEIRVQDLHKLDDEMVVAELIKLKGVGPWTAEMFLMFTLGRPDVFSYLDLGLIRAFEKIYGVTNPSREEMERIVAKWSPFRTYAALALWHHKDNKPIIDI